MLHTNTLLKSAGVKKLQPQEVMSTNLYTGTGASQTVTTGTDLLGKGGLVWLKKRDTAQGHVLVDSARGLSSFLRTETTDADGTTSSVVTNLSSTGFVLGTGFNTSGGTYAAWSFRRAPKFFDVVTYTGDGVAGRQIAHSLGTTPGMIIVKVRNQAFGWQVAHRSLTGTQEGLTLETTGATVSSSSWSGTFPTAHTASYFTVGNAGATNAAGNTYVAYLFAHDPSTDGIIQCGSYTGNGSTSGPVVTLGWKPQWVMVKAASGTGDWYITDTARGMGVGTESFLSPNTAAAEGVSNILSTSSTGFQIETTGGGYNASGATYVFMAIRSRIPTAAEQVINDQLVGSFATKTYTGTGGTQTITTGLDMAGKGGLVWGKRRSGTVSHALYDTVRGAAKYSSTDRTDAETAAPNGLTSFTSTGFTLGSGAGSGVGDITIDPVVSWSFTRQAKFFDIVTYTGNGVAGRQIPHSLGVVPGMIVVKSRNSGSENWSVYHRSLSGNIIKLNTTEAGAADNGGRFGNAVTPIDPTTSAFTVGNHGSTNSASNTYVAYLFAQNTDLIDCGSYTGNGSTTGPVVTCGSGWKPQWLLVKQSSGANNWQINDAQRSPSDPRDLFLVPNTSAAEAQSSLSSIAYTPSGFQPTSAQSTINASGQTYIYMAIREPLI